MERFAAALGRLLQVVLTLLKTIFGEFNFTPPPWWARSKARMRDTALERGIFRFSNWRKANPERFRKIAGTSVATVLILGLAGHFAWEWWASRPRPDYVEMSLEKPGTPDYRNKKVYPLAVVFSKSAAQATAVGKTATTGIQLTPPIEGQWKWATDRRLEFTPAGFEHPNGEWKVGQAYKIKFAKEMFPSHLVFESLDIQFETEGLSGSITNQDFYQDPKDPNNKRATFTVVQNLSAKAYQFTVVPDGLPTTVHINSDQLEIPRDDSVAVLKISKGVRHPKGGASGTELSSEVDVPGLLNYFRFTNTQVEMARNQQYEPEQVLILNTKAEAVSETIAKTLKVWLLPVKHPDHPKTQRYDWDSPGDITAAVKGNMKDVPFTTIPSAGEASNLHSYRIDAPVGRYLYVKIEKGLKSFGGYELAQDYETIFQVPEYPKELMIMAEGSILSYSGEKKIPLLARNIGEVEFTLHRVLPQQLNQMMVGIYGSDSGSFQKPYWYERIAQTLSERFKEKRTLTITSPKATQYFSFDLEPYLQKDPSHKGVFYLEVKEKNGSISDQRIIVLTDLGIIVKETMTGKHEVFVQNIKSGLGDAGVDVEVIGANGIPVISEKTDANGRASVPNLNDFADEKRPLAFIAKSGNDLAFLPYKQSSRALDFSRFDVGGVYESENSDRLYAFMFSDRGIYRPGDKINIGGIVRSRNWKDGFADLPVTWTVSDPRGSEIVKEVVKASSSDLVSLTFGTQETSVTGTYSVQMFITKKDKSLQLIGSTTVEVKEFVPDRLRIMTSLSKQKVQGWVTPEELSATVTLQNLFGTAAENRLVRATLKMIPAQPHFSAFKDYSFARFETEQQTVDETLEEQRTNQEGISVFSLDLSKIVAPMFYVRFTADGFESEAGRSVGSSAQTLVSTLPYLIGVKDDGARGYIKANSEHHVEMVAVGPDLKQVKSDELKLFLVEKTYVSSLMKQSNGLYKYQSVLKEVVRKEDKISVPAAGLKLKLPTEQAGDFA
ncbi:MAG: MG2 domain-containing protein, partial [Bdellovibrionia bacterium]